MLILHLAFNLMECVFVHFKKLCSLILRCYLIGAVPPTYTEPVIDKVSNC